jgi:hypothetical protein
MKAARRFEGLAKAVILGLIVATFVFAPLGVVPVSADGGSIGQPGDPPKDSTLNGAVIINPDVANESLMTSIDYLSLLRFIDL